MNRIDVPLVKGGVSVQGTEDAGDNDGDTCAARRAQFKKRRLSHTSNDVHCVMLRRFGLSLSEFDVATGKSLGG
jgi:hypothetical protein